MHANIYLFFFGSKNLFKLFILYYLKL